MADATASARARDPRLHRAPEPEVLAPLLRDAALDADSRRRVETRARAMLAELRDAQSRGWVNQFLQEYRLNTQEGVALLSLAEAFLRVPDPETADSLIADKLGEGDWRAHKGKSNSTLVNTATWGLVIGRALVSESEQASALKRLIAPRRRALRPPGGRRGDADDGRDLRHGPHHRRGDRADDASARMRASPPASTCSARRRAPSPTPSAISHPTRRRSARSARSRARAIRISVKLSALHPRYEVAQYERCVPALIEQVEALATLAAKLGIHFTIDAEETERLEMSLDIIEAVAGLPALKGWDGLGMAIQAYGKRARPTIAWADALGAQTGRRIAARLVKGAYWDTEIKRTQEQGLSDYPLFTRKAATDVSYLACAKDMLAAKHIYPGLRHPQCADRRHPARMGGRQPRLRVPAAARHGRGALREPGPRAGLSHPHLRAGRRPSRPARLSRPAAAREWRQFLLRPPARRREPDRRAICSPIRSPRSPRSAAPAIPRSRCPRTCSRPSGRTARGSTSTTGRRWTGSPRRSRRRSTFKPSAGLDRRRSW